MSSISELIDITGGDVSFHDACQAAAFTVNKRWPTISVEELTQMISVEAMAKSKTLVKNIHGAGKPEKYLMSALVREGNRAATEAIYSEAVSGVASGSDEDVDWYEEVDPFGTPTGIYSTDAVRAALTALDWPGQDDPLMSLVFDGLLQLQEKDRNLLVDHFAGDGVETHTQYVTLAVDRLTRIVNRG